jgi:hypothetical protein
MFYVKKGSKYGAKKSSFNGITYHSKKEAQYAGELEMRKKAGDIKDWKRQVKIDLKAYDKHICNYYMDFVITHNDNTLEYIEVKGFATPLWQMKWKLFEAQMAEECRLNDTKLTIVKV